MTDGKLEKLEHEVGQLKKEIIGIRRMVVTIVKEPIIIEQLSEERLTKKEKKLMNEALDDLRKGRKDRFVSLDELKRMHKSSS